jgi:hypothetical protein
MVEGLIVGLYCWFGGWMGQWKDRLLCDGCKSNLYFWGASAYCICWGGMLCTLYVIAYYVRLGTVRMLCMLYISAYNCVCLGGMLCMLYVIAYCVRLGSMLCMLYISAYYCVCLEGMLCVLYVIAYCTIIIIFVWLIRKWGSRPEVVAFAICVNPWGLLFGGLVYGMLFSASE